MDGKINEILLNAEQVNCGGNARIMVPARAVCPTCSGYGGWARMSVWDVSAKGLFPERCRFALHSHRALHRITGALAKAIKSAFGSYDAFKKKFSQNAVTLFGSGWAWLVKNKDGTIAIEQTGKAGIPMTAAKKTLLTCDVREHAYYIDYHNARPKYVEAFGKLREICTGRRLL